MLYMYINGLNFILFAKQMNGIKATIHVQFCDLFFYMSFPWVWCKLFWIRKLVYNVFREA